MDGTKLVGKVYKGYGIAAKKIGFVHSQYRSATAINPISPSNLLSSNFYASFNINWAYNKANRYGNSVYQMVADGRFMQRGDYFVGYETWFVIGMDPVQPILAVQCNSVVDVRRPQMTTAKGSVGYMGDKPTQNDTILMQSIPCSILEESGRGRENPVKLAMDSTWSRWEVLIPYLGGVKIDIGDTVVSGNDLYMVDSNELTDLGWRLRVKRTVV